MFIKSILFTVAFLPHLISAAPALPQVTKSNLDTSTITKRAVIAAPSAGSLHPRDLFADASKVHARYGKKASRLQRDMVGRQNIGQNVIATPCEIVITLGAKVDNALQSQPAIPIPSSNIQTNAGPSSPTRKTKALVSKINTTVLGSTISTNIFASRKATGQAVRRPAPSAASKGSSKAEVNTTPGDGNATFYLSDITIGDQLMHLTFDTGSADFWLHEGYNGTEGFYPNQSSTFRTMPNESFSINYLDGSGANGYVGTDTITLGNIIVPDQAMGIAEVEIKTNTIFGLVGLGLWKHPQVSPTRVTSFLYNLMAQLEQQLFTVVLSKQGTSEFEFGSIDGSKYNGDIFYADIVVSDTKDDEEFTHWQFGSSSVTFGGVTYAMNMDETVIADTGASLAYINDAVVSAYYAQIPGASNETIVDVTSFDMWHFPCDAQLLDFYMEFGNTGYQLKLPATVIKQFPLTNSQPKLCLGGLQSAIGLDIQLIGDAILSQHFTVFDVASQGTPRIGFADKA